MERLRDEQNENQQAKVFADISPIWIGIECSIDFRVDVGAYFRNSGEAGIIPQSERRADLL